MSPTACGGLQRNGAQGSSCLAHAIRMFFGDTGTQTRIYKGTMGAWGPLGSVL